MATLTYQNHCVKKLSNKTCQASATAAPFCPLKMRASAGKNKILIKYSEKSYLWLKIHKDSIAELRGTHSILQCQI